MALPSRASCEPEMKWVLKAGINIDPATLAKNLTTLCTVAFSATVLYFMYSNGSKRPQLTQHTQYSEDEESSDADHTVNCKTRCRHSVVGTTGNITKPPHDKMMSFGIPLEDVQSSPSYCPLDAQIQTLPDIPIADGEKSWGIDDARTQTVPESISVATESFVDSIQGLLTLVEPSTLSTTSGPDEAQIQPSEVSSCTQILPPTSSTASGPDNSCLCSGFTEDPGCTRAKDGFLRHVNGGESNWEEVGKDEDGGSHFEGYIYGIIREKGSKSYKRRLYGGVSSERRQQGDGARFKEACTQLENGIDVCENISTGERPQKVVEVIQKNNLEFVSAPSRECPRQRDSCTQTDLVKAEKSTSVRPSKQLSHATTMGKGVINFVDSSSASNNCKKACVGRPLTRLPTLPKAENFDKCRDQVTGTSVGNLPEFGTRGAWTGRPFKQKGAVPKAESTCHLIDSNGFGVDEIRRVGEKIRDFLQLEPPLEQSKSSLVTLTETEHWSKMTLPEQYECLGLLDSTLAEASAEWKGKRDVTYWRHKDLDPGPSKLSGLSSLCKPQGSTESPNMERAHLHMERDSNCANIASSAREEFCAEVTCVEAHQILQDKQEHRAPLSSYNHQLAFPSAAGNNAAIRPAQNRSLQDDLSRRANTAAECRRLQSEAARETRTLNKLLAKNSKYHYM